MSRLRLLLVLIAATSACGGVAPPAHRGESQPAGASSGSETPPLPVQLTPGPERAPVVFQSTPEGQAVSVGGEKKCVTPCTLYVYPGRLYFHPGDTSRREGGLVAEVPPAGLDLRIRHVPPWKEPLGLTFAILGGAGIVVGLFTAVGSVLVNDGEKQTPTGLSILYGGATAMVTGAVLLVPAVILLSLSQTGIESKKPLGKGRDGSEGGSRQ